MQPNQRHEPQTTDVPPTIILTRSCYEVVFVPQTDRGWSNAPSPELPTYRPSLVDGVLALDDALVLLGAAITWLAIIGRVGALRDLVQGLLELS
jgi:hypothetical protein